MTTITIGKIKLSVNVQATVNYYNDKTTFICDCFDCQNYLGHLDKIKIDLEGLDEKLGIDLSKDVGIGSDELMSNVYDNHLLYVIPYYIIGKILSSNETSFKLNERISFKIHNYNYKDIMNIKEDAFCLWLEIQLPL